MNESERQEAERLANSFMDLYEDMMFFYKHNVVPSTARINDIIRYTMVGMVVMMIAILALVATFTSRKGAITSDMTDMATNMERMHSDFTRVTEDMRNMQTAVARMDGYVRPMPAMLESVGGMGDNMGRMRNDLLTVAENMQEIQVRMLSMGRNLQAMDQKLVDMSGAVGGIGHDVDIMSRPRPMSILPNN